jgi:hypothetical protein
MKTHRRFALFAMLACTFVFGCRSTYYAAWEKLGKHKRDLLREHVNAAREEQKAATDQFKDALTRLKELYNFHGGDLEKLYDKLKSDYEKSAGKADSVRKRIGKVETVAADLFSEWEKELKTISNDRLRDSSAANLRETRRKFETLHAAMKRAEKSMEPVLRQFHDHVLYLKHNLNAQAIGALKGEAVDIEREIGRLIDDMNASIAEAGKFVESLPDQ